ncbi:MAG: 50S ribosomal protein L35ae [Minisyncoccales bacterium]
MEGTIVNYRMSRHTQHPRHVIIKVEGYEDKEKAKELVGKEIKWKTPAKTENFIKGKITKVHGNSGAVRALCETGMPGQAIGKKVQIN